MPSGNSLWSVALDVRPPPQSLAGSENHSRMEMLFQLHCFNCIRQRQLAFLKGQQLSRLGVGCRMTCSSCASGQKRQKSWWHHVSSLLFMVLEQALRACTPLMMWHTTPLLYLCEVEQAQVMPLQCTSMPPGHSQCPMICYAESLSCMQDLMRS